MWKRSHGHTTKAPPDERGGNGYVQPKATAPHLDSTLVVQKRAGGALTPSTALGGSATADDVGGSYALIAAISGLLPMMFMTRVIL